jgi:hypothetical protein
MDDEVGKEGYSFVFEKFIEYLKTAPKGFILFWIIIFILLFWSVARAWSYLGMFF